MALIAASQSASLATSSFTNCAFPPAPVMLAATFCPSASTSATITLAPSRAKITASLSPIPCAAPVTMATLPLSRIAVSSLKSG